MQEKILVVEDDKDLSKIICAYLKKEGYSVICAYDGAQGLQLANQENPLLILLDIMLPEIDGHELCRRIRTDCVVPIIVISAKGEETDKIISLGIGADDYLTKPFSLLELGARVKSQLRRYTVFDQAVANQENNNKNGMQQDSTSSTDSKSKKEEVASSIQDTNCKCFGDLVIDPIYYKVTVNGKELDLTAREFKLLDFFTDHPRQVFTKEQLMDQVWGYTEYIDNNTVTVYVGRVRDKLKVHNVNYIKTVWGVGYRWEM